MSRFGGRYSTNRGGGGNYYGANQQQTNNIRAGLCGLFFTVDADEKRGVQEAYNLIDHFIVEETRKFDVEKKDEANLDAGQQDKDISDSLSSACQQMVQTKKWPSNRSSGTDIRQFSTGARCSLFFATPTMNSENVYKLADQMVEKCQNENRTRFLARVIPVEDTCSAYMDQILPLLSAMLAKHLADYSSPNNSKTSSDAQTPSPTYAIDFKASNSKLLGKQQIYDEVTKIVKEQSPGSTVNLTQPDLLVVVHVIRTVCLLSIIRNYYQKRKFALRIQTDNDGESESNKGANKKAEEKVEDGNKSTENGEE